MLPEETSKFSKIAQSPEEAHWDEALYPVEPVACYIDPTEPVTYCVLHVVCVCDTQKPKHRCQGPCIFLYHELIFLVRQTESLFWTPFWYHWLDRGEYFRFPTSFPYFLTCWILYLRHKCYSFMFPEDCGGASPLPSLSLTAGLAAGHPPPAYQRWLSCRTKLSHWAGVPTKHQHINTFGHRGPDVFLLLLNLGE